MQWRCQEFSFGTPRDPGAARNFHLGLPGIQAVPGIFIWDSQGSRGSGDKVPQKLKQFADVDYSFDCRNDQNLKISLNLPDSRPVYMFHCGGAK